MIQRSTEATAAIKELRRLIELEIESELAYKKAKGLAYVTLVDGGETAAVAWQRIASHPGLIELERAHLLARAERLCAYLAIVSGSSSVPSLGPDGEGPDDG